MNHSRQPSAASEALSPQAAAVISRHHERMTKVVLDAREQTVRSLADVRASVDAVARVAHSHVREIHAAIGRLASESSEGSVALTIAQLDIVVTRYIEVVIRETDAQQAQAAKAATRCDEVLRTLVDIGRVASAAKLLSVNAIIKSKTVSDGEAMSAIATKLSALTAQLTSVNRQVTTVGRVLVAALPAIAEEARAIRELSLAFVSEFRREIAKLGPRARGLRDALDAVLKAGESRLQAILTEAQKAHDALSFETRFLAALDAVEAGALHLQAAAAASAE